MTFHVWLVLLDTIATSENIAIETDCYTPDNWLFFFYKIKTQIVANNILFYISFFFLSFSLQLGTILKINPSFFGHCRIIVPTWISFTHAPLHDSFVLLLHAAVQVNELVRSRFTFLIFNDIGRKSEAI